MKTQRSITVALILYFAMAANVSADPATDEKGSLKAYTAPWYFNIRSGIHFMRESSSMNSESSAALASNILLREDLKYHSLLVIERQKINYIAPFLSIEFLGVINFRKLPWLKKKQYLRSNQTIYGGIGVAYYPSITTSTPIYEGKIDYQNLATADQNLRTMDYHGYIDLEESFFSVIPEIALYYMFPAIGKELGFAPYSTRFFTGFSAGLGFLSGKRVMSLTTRPLNVNSESYNVSARYQDTVFDGIGFRGTFTIGAMMFLFGWHFIEMRMTLIHYETQAAVTRSGYWSETQADSAGNVLSAVARRNINENINYVFSQSGFLITIGYTARLI